MVLTTLLSVVLPQWYPDLLMLPGGFVLGLLLSAVMPGGFLSLIFAGIFVWLLGSQLESAFRPWQYVVIFVGSGVAGSLAAMAVGGFGTAGSFAAFGLAGSYAYFLSRSASREQSLQWVLVLLLINVVLTGFNHVALAAMFGAFLAGLGLTAATQRAF
jgi:membrane associated rhomboid family serine protease